MCNTNNGGQLPSKKVAALKDSNHLPGCPRSRSVSENFLTFPDVLALALFPRISSPSRMPSLSLCFCSSLSLYYLLSNNRSFHAYEILIIPKCPRSRSVPVPLSLPVCAIPTEAECFSVSDSPGLKFWSYSFSTGNKTR
jgi:hypothetical protein